MLGQKKKDHVGVSEVNGIRKASVVYEKVPEVVPKVYWKENHRILQLLFSNVEFRKV